MYEILQVISVFVHDQILVFGLQKDGIPILGHRKISHMIRYRTDLGIRKHIGENQHATDIGAKTNDLFGKDDLCHVTGNGFIDQAAVQQILITDTKILIQSSQMHLF